MPEDVEPLPTSEQRTLARTTTSSAGSFDRYRLLQRLGEGGMGEVWLAEQTEPVRRQVALKVIKAGMDSAQVIARFEAERQALALMDHQAIATVFDGGTTPQGRPYFAMEYVKGEPITVYCDRHRLTTRERLELFTQVCDGVQHAHQKGIIHRDLKPSNVLVSIQDDRPVPKIIDFGVAKATARHLTERSLFTELGVLIGTPEYMSPEQAEMGGLDIDTRSDIYSLGTLLYELLTAALPFGRTDLRQVGISEIQRIIREQEPSRPSVRITEPGVASADAAKNRRTELRRLVAELRGDLDWITMRALEKDRTRRYQTANALTADVRRHLNSEPVSAGPPSTLYRAKKFLRRHRVGAGVAATLVVLLVAFGLTMAVQAQRVARERDRANREAEAARQVSDFLVRLFAVSDPSEARGNSLTARELLDKGALEVAQALKDQPRLQARLQATLGAVYTSLGLYSEALPLLRRATETQGRLLGSDDTETLDGLHLLANLYWYQDKPKEAESLYMDVVARRRRTLGAEHPKTLQAEFDLASSYLADGRLDDAERLNRSVLEAQRRTLGDEHRDTLASMNNLASLYFQKARYAEAERLQRTVWEIELRQLGSDHPDPLQSAHNVAGALIGQGRYDEAQPLLASTLEARRRVMGAGHPSTLGTQAALARVYRGQGRFVEAEALYLSSHRGLVEALGPDHRTIRQTVGSLVAFYEAWGKPEKARAWRAKLEATPAPAGQAK